MVFSSLEFIFVFLILFLAAYYIMPSRGRNFILLFCSLLFYAYGNFRTPAFFFLLLLSILVNYVLARLIQASPAFLSPKASRFWLVCGLVYNLGWLFFFKYVSSQALPLGISFYTFQMISYLVDVYRGDIPAERSLSILATYFCMFPQLTSGPLVRYENIEFFLRERRCYPEDVESGLKTFVLGLGMKVLLANQLAGLWRDVHTIGYESISTPLAWMGIVGYSLQLYFDFYGYSLMAVGIGQMLGFTLPLNFYHPYTSRTMSEFWRRWHTSLGSWFRDYLYIPLGGNRGGFFKTTRNLAIVWLCTGIWHGASLNFLLWALFLFVLICIEKAGLGKVLNKYPVLGHLYMYMAIPISWLLFAISDMSQLSIYFRKLFPFLGEAGKVLFPGDYLKYGRLYALYLLVGLLFATSLPAKFYQKNNRKPLVILALLVVFWASVYCLLQGMDDPFMYFKF